MAIGTLPIGTAAIADLTAAELAATYATVLRSYSVLLEIDAYPLTGGATRTFAGIGANAIGRHPIGDIGDTRTFVLEANTLRYSDGGYISLNGDVPPATFYPPRLEGLVVERAVSLSPDSDVDGAQAADASLIGVGGGLDNIVANNVVDGRPARVLIVPKDGSLSDARIAFAGVVENWGGSAEQIGVRMADYSFVLETPVQTNIYGGTGGADGTSEVAGRQKPLCYGNVKNMTPTLIVPNLLIYQAHDGAVQAFDAVYDSGLALSLDTAIGTSGDFASYATLAAATIAAGKYATCKAAGLFRLNATPGGLVTADVRGDATGSYIDTVPAIAARILARMGLSGSQVDYGSFTDLAVDCPWEAGYLIDDAALSGRQALQQLLSGIGCYWYALRDRRIHAARLTVPTLDELQADFTAVEFLSLEELEPPDTVYPPTWRRRVGYAVNWTTQTDGFAGAVTDARRAELAQPYRVIASADSNIRTAHLRARDPEPLVSHVIGSTGANTIAQRLQTLHGSPRKLYQGVVQARFGLPLDMGACVRITYPRFGLSGGKLVRAFPVREDYTARTVTMLFWG